VKATRNDEPIPFNRVGDTDRIGFDRAQVAEGFPSLRLAAMRIAVFSTALIFGGLRRLVRRFGAVLFGIFAIRVQVQRGLVQPRRDTIGRLASSAVTASGGPDDPMTALKAWCLD
jgi:hypothetical protein